jgi:hypothetical protein
MTKVFEFRSSTKPFMTIWSVGDTQVFGSLIWLNDRPLLTLFVEVEARLAPNFKNPRSALLELTKPPNQVTIRGTVPTYGPVTLERCVLYESRETPDTRTGKSTYELDLVPAAVWLGAKELVDGNVTTAIAHDRRLVGFFGAAGVRKYYRFDPEAATLFETLNQPQSIWAVYGPGERRIKLGETGWELSIYSQPIEGVSTTKGLTLHSTISLSIQSNQPTTIEKADNVLSRLEEIISVFSIEPFTSQTKEYQSNEFTSVILVWRLGDDHNLFRPPMRRQILLDLRNEKTLETICKQWFGASETSSLSRSLFVRALKETDDGLSRFVAVAQAFEVLGRELGPHESMAKSRLKEAVELVSQALKGKFENGFIERTVKTHPVKQQIFVPRCLTPYAGPDGRGPQAR